MAQTTVLAAAQTVAASSAIDVASGSSLTVGIFSSYPIPQGVQLNLMLDTPGDDAPIATLSRAMPAVVLTGPGTYYVKRGDISAYGVSVGAFTDDGA